MKQFAENEYVIWAELNQEWMAFFEKKCGELDRNHIVPGIRPPHMTLTFVRTEEPERLAEYTKRFFKKRNSLLRLNTLSMFPGGVLFYAPKATDELLALQRDYCEGISKFAELSWDLYFPGNWTPHIALTGALAPEEAMKAFSILMNGFSSLPDSALDQIVVRKCGAGEALLTLSAEESVDGGTQFPADVQPGARQEETPSTELLSCLDRLHTTPLGAERIRKNLSLDTEDVTAWCRERILDPSAVIMRKGKNWYVETDGCILTVNAYSYTIITAHRTTIRNGART